MGHHIVLSLLVVSLIVTGGRGAVSSDLPAGTCVCATAGVNGRSSGSLSAAIVGGLGQGECVKTVGGRVYSDGYNWYQVSHNGGTMWIAGSYLVQSSTGCGGTSGGGCPTIISRAAWGARSPASVSYLQQPVRYVFIHHTDGAECFTSSSCSSQVYGIQGYHMNSNGWSDIGYNFLVGGDGNIYEGRGWDRVGSHTYGYNSQGIAFSFIGTFSNKSPTQAALNAVQRAIQCGVNQGKISSSYTLRGHRDMNSTECPGNTLYNIIRGWSHYK